MESLKLVLEGINMQRLLKGYSDQDEGGCDGQR